MRRSLLPLLLGALTAKLSAAPLPGGFDHSGWYEFEVIVLVDSRTNVLESETWPLLPHPGYPSRWRWLVDRTPNSQNPLQAHNVRLRRSLSGHTMISESSPLPAPWLPSDRVLTEGDLALIDELIDLGMGTAPADRMPSLPEEGFESPEQTEAAPVDLLLPFEVNKAETPPAPLLSLESLVLEGTPPTSERGINVPFAPAEQFTELLPVTVSATGIPFPLPFERLPLDSLAPGLERYRRENSEEIIAAAAWLQGPGSENLPIMMEPETSNGYPRAQGFIQLVPRANSWRLGLNFWANTDGHYLPAVFEMDPPPPSPPRTTRVPGAAAEQGLLATSDSGHRVQMSDGTVINVGPDVGASADETSVDDKAALLKGDPSANEDYTPPRPPDWPWRHVIHVADTVPLAENRLRYYDHPVIKVLAIWRELSWYELYRRGVQRMDVEQPPTTD